MYLIKRGPAPQELTKAKASLQEKLADSSTDVWGEFDSAVPGAKEAVKKALLEKQRYVCCYCTGRISYETMKVEHWAPQSGHPEKRLDWSNLFAACDGGERSGVELHCDASKGSTEIILDPSKKEHINKLIYFTSGKMGSQEESHQAEIDSNLNLNTAQLTSARQAAWDGFRQFHELKREKVPSDKKYVDKMLEKALELVNRDQAKPYMDIVLYFLKRKHSSS